MERVMSNAGAMPVRGQLMSVLLSSKATLPETGFLRQPQVLSFIPISKSTLWRRVMEGTFPAPIKLSPRVTAWRVEDVRRWIEQQNGQT
jgi:predicted DNA-binding transcriptional regulator AlpA